MTWVKVCGLRRREDVEVAVEAGADAIGLVLVPESPRRIGAETAARLAVGLPVPAVILTRDLTPEQVLDLAGEIGAGGVQPYGRHAPAVAERAAAAGLLVLWPVAVVAAVDLRDVPPEWLPLTDSTKGGGGTGQAFDWTHLPRSGRPFVLAGGLGPDNVAAAIEAVQPYGVDASSLLESRPGVKDPQLMSRFVRAAKARG